MVTGLLLFGVFFGTVCDVSYDMCSLVYISCCMIGILSLLRKVLDMRICMPGSRVGARRCCRGRGALKWQQAGCICTCTLETAYLTCRHEHGAKNEARESQKPSVSSQVDLTCRREKATKNEARDGGSQKHLEYGSFHAFQKLG